MRQKHGTQKPPAEKVMKDIRRRTRKQHSAEENILIVLEGLRGDPRWRLRLSCHHSAVARRSFSPAPEGQQTGG